MNRLFIVSAAALAILASTGKALTLDEAWQYDIEDLAAELIAAANERAYALLKDRVWIPGQGGTSNLVERYWVDPIDTVSYVVAWNGEWTTVVTNTPQGIATNAYPDFEYAQGDEPEGYLWASLGNHSVSSGRRYWFTPWEYLLGGGAALFKPVTNEFFGNTFRVIGNYVQPIHYSSELYSRVLDLIADEYFVRADRTTAEALEGDGLPFYFWDSYYTNSLPIEYWQPSISDWGDTPDGPIRWYYPYNLDAEYNNENLRMRVKVDSKWQQLSTAKPRLPPALGLDDYLMSNGVGRTTTWTTRVTNLTEPIWTNTPGWRQGQYSSRSVSNSTDQLLRISRNHGITNFLWDAERPTSYASLWDTNSPSATYTNLVPLYEVSFRLGTNWSTTNVIGGVTEIIDYQQVLTENRDIGTWQPTVNYLLHTPDELKTSRVVVKYHPPDATAGGLDAVEGPIVYRLISDRITNVTYSGTEYGGGTEVRLQPITVTHMIDLVAISGVDYQDIDGSGYKLSSFTHTNAPPWQQVLQRKRGEDWPTYPLHARWTVYWKPFPYMLDASGGGSYWAYSQGFPDWDRSWMVAAWNQLESMQSTRLTSWGLPGEMTNRTSILQWFNTYNYTRTPYTLWLNVTTNNVVSVPWEPSKNAHSYASMASITDQPETEFAVGIDRSYMHDGTPGYGEQTTIYSKLHTGGTGALTAYKSTNSAGRLTVNEVQYHYARGGAGSWMMYPDQYSSDYSSHDLQQHWYKVNPRWEQQPGYSFWYVDYDRYDVAIHVYTLDLDELPSQLFSKDAGKGSDRIDASWSLPPWKEVPELSIDSRWESIGPKPPWDDYDTYQNSDFGGYRLRGRVREIFLWHWDFDHPVLP